MLIRAATLADLDAVRETEDEVFRADLYPRFFFRQAYDLWPHLLRVAELPSGRLAGHLVGALSSREGEAWILSAAVRAEHRGQGVATRLIESLLDVLAGSPVREVRLTVRPDNASALSLYARLGFRPAADEADYYGRGERRLVMRLQLPRG